MWKMRSYDIRTRDARYRISGQSGYELLFVGLLAVCYITNIFSRWATLGIFAVSIYILINTFFLAPRRRRRLAKFVWDHEFMVCPGCLYRLEGLILPRPCPECGRHNDRDELRRTWNELIS